MLMLSVFVLVCFYACLCYGVSVSVCVIPLSPPLFLLTLATDLLFSCSFSFVCMFLLFVFVIIIS